jgi:hypothetical protein
MAGPRSRSAYQGGAIGLASRRRVSISPRGVADFHRRRRGACDLLLVVLRNSYPADSQGSAGFSIFPAKLILLSVPGRPSCAGFGPFLSVNSPAWAVFVTKCRIVTFAPFIVLGTWTISASSQPNEANVPRPCSTFPRFCELITQEAGRTGLDPRLIHAVIKVESDYRPDAIGAAGEIGLMQVRPSTARLLGFGGTDRELAEPATNIRLGVTYLAKAWSLARGDLFAEL